MKEEDLLLWLRCQIKAIEDSAAYIAQTPLQDLSDDDIDVHKFLRGEIAGLEHVIQHLKGLSWREFQLRKKKGTL